MATSTFVESTEVETTAAAAVFAALGDPVRLRILSILAATSRCVCDIHAQVPIAANLLSYHLRVLREAGLVEGSRRGRWVDYRLTPGAGTMVTAALRLAGFGATVDQPAHRPDVCDAS